VEHLFSYGDTHKHTLVGSLKIADLRILGSKGSNG
jgi:hypothetical protein